MQFPAHGGEESMCVVRRGPKGSARADEGGLRACVGPLVRAGGRGGQGRGAPGGGATPRTHSRTHRSDARATTDAASHSLLRTPRCARAENAQAPRARSTRAGTSHCHRCEDACSNRHCEPCESAGLMRWRDLRPHADTGKMHFAHGSHFFHIRLLCADVTLVSLLFAPSAFHPCLLLVQATAGAAARVPLACSSNCGGQHGPQAAEAERAGHVQVHGQGGSRQIHGWA
jgi:hypothetical protein